MQLNLSSGKHFIPCKIRKRKDNELFESQH